MHRLEATLRTAVITLLLTLGFIAGWPRVSPRLLAKLPGSLAERLSRIPELQGRLLAPFAPIASAFGIYGENWALFATTGGTRNRIHVEARRQGSRDFTLLYRVHDADHRYLAQMLEYRRVRNIWNPHRSGLSQGYEPFAHWLIQRTLRDHPEFDAVRIRMQEGKILPYGRGFEPNGRFQFEVQEERSAP